MRMLAVTTNKEFASALSIPASASITCVKPSGTVSQLVDSASGIHARHSQYYIRRVRNDNKDPITTFLQEKGIPSEADVMKPNDTTIFSFPMKAPEGCVLRDDLDSFTHLRLWLAYQRHWCEHKPSVTVYVKEEDWPAVGAWVWKHFDEINEETYNQLLAGMPPEVNWNDFIETDDNVEGAQTLACTAGACEI